MKKIASILLFSALSLLSADNVDHTMRLINAKDTYTDCVTTNLKKDYNQFQTFIKSTPKEKLNYQSVNGFVKDYMINLMKEDLCNDSFDIYLEESIDWDKKLSKNKDLSKPEDFDFASYNRNLIIEMTASHIYNFFLLKEKK